MCCNNVHDNSRICYLYCTATLTTSSVCEMLRQGVCVSRSLVVGGQNAALRNVSARVLKRCNSTMVATQARPEEWDYAKPFEDMPGPKPLPIIGNTWRFIPHIGDLYRLTEESYHRDLYEMYGKIMKITGIPGVKNMVMVFDPDVIEKVYRNEGPWPIRDTATSLAYYRLITRKDFFQGVGGVAITQGEIWQKFRSKVNPTMMQPRSTKLYVAPIDSVANDFLKRIRLIRDENLEMPDDFANELCKWGLESIVYIALDTRLGCLDADLAPDSEPQKMIDCVSVVFDCLHVMESKIPMWKYVSTPTWRKFLKASDMMTEFCMKHINQAMERLKAMPEDPDRELTVLEKLLITDPDPKTAIVMALDMMGAGVDTTSYSTAVAVYYLAQNPEKQQKLFQEILRYLPDKDQPVTSEILTELKYLKACIKESMRLSPLFVANQRETVKDMVLADYQIPKGTSIFMPFTMLGHMEQYCPEANKFIPERWLKTEQEHSKRAHPFVTMPFGFGPRMCVGRRFADLEMETLVAKCSSSGLWKFT
ncbi:putative cytochrome P450 301a1, mitochondrial [Cryptotermes secundus]|uniref:Putative cytochrome P450 301a1, mitochondrial n=1 Tax=Cryptotermes secundus TaxID=105785 RepID=A0A2J7RNP0_9NEOP|nr:probable cytochrome P450 301a1, mitochondrial isoform X2 [Cryptotermes secundus]PNF42439.1 putative cytochrome P450 301a1, mitochondrial [Cryptotermes secundus]